VLGFWMVCCFKGRAELSTPRTPCGILFCDLVLGLKYMPGALSAGAYALVQNGCSLWVPFLALGDMNTLFGAWVLHC
jgi:hypothetical protein